MKPLHIFKPGTHTAMCGTTLNFTESDLTATVAAYNPTLHEAPIVIGHPTHDAPAAGWIKSLSATAQGLIAVPQQVDATFAEQVAKGSYKKISASFYHPNAANNPVPGVYYLRHVGFLGAQPPAIKGLRPIELADDEQGVIEFSDHGHYLSADLWRRFRTWLIGQPEQPLQTAFAEPTQTPQVTHMPEQDTAALEAENKRLKADIAQRDNAARRAAQSAIHTASVDYAEKLVAAGMKPVHAPTIIAALDYAESSSTPLEFGEADARQPLSEGLKSLFNDLTGAINFTEVATKSRADNTSTQPTENPLLADAEARAQR